MKKYFLLGLILGCIIVGTQSKAAEVGLVQTKGSPTCEQADEDFRIAGVRWAQVKKLREVTIDSSMQLALDTELRALTDLGGRILMWKSENCRET